jgi:hypothetical protein
MDKQRLIDIAINWFPVLLLVAVWWWYCIVRMGSGPYSKYQKECLDLTRRQVEALERIASTLDKRV